MPIKQGRNQPAHCSVIISRLLGVKDICILADYSLPSFDGLSALNIAKRKCPRVPFIFFSGAIGEDFAIETIKKGATDYVLKDGLSRLPAAINRALLEVEEHTKLRRAEKELEQYRKHLEEMVRDRTSELKKVNEQLQLELVPRTLGEDVKRNMLAEGTHHLAVLTHVSAPAML